MVFQTLFQYGRGLILLLWKKDNSTFLTLYRIYICDVYFVPRFFTTAKNRPTCVRKYVQLTNSWHLLRPQEVWRGCESGQSEEVVCRECLPLRHYASALGKRTVVKQCVQLFYVIVAKYICL